MPEKHCLLSSPIPQVLQTMTLPMIIGLLAVLTFNLVDTFFVSMLGTQSLAAISFTFPITFVVSCITLGIGVGLSANIALLLGQKKVIQAANLASHGIILALLLVMLTSIFGYFFIKPLFYGLGASHKLLVLIEQYMKIWYLSIPLLVIPMTANSVIRATGDTKTPAQIMIISRLINGILDPIVIFGYGPFAELGIQGAAIASAASWLGAAIASLFILIKRDNLLPLSGTILMVMLANLGVDVIAAYGAAQRIESIMIIALMALSSVLTTFMHKILAQASLSAVFLPYSFRYVFLCFFSLSYIY